MSTDDRRPDIPIDPTEIAHTPEPEEARPLAGFAHRALFERTNI